MSRLWNEHKYSNADDLWCWIDEQSQELDRQVEEAKEASSESYKLLLMGRREMIDRVCAWLHENQITLGDIAKRFGAMVKNDKQQS